MIVGNSRIQIHGSIRRYPMRARSYRDEREAALRQVAKWMREDIHEFIWGPRFHKSMNTMFLACIIGMLCILILPVVAKMVHLIGGAH